MHLGSGTDEISNYAWGCVIETGQGEDVVRHNGFGLVTDLAEEDSIWLTEDRQLFGATRFDGSENPWSYDISGVAYGFNGTELLIGLVGGGANDREEKSLFISDFALGEGGINLFTIFFDFVPFSDFEIDPIYRGTGAGWKAVWCAFNTAMFGPQGSDPLALDLDGDGLELDPMTGLTAMPFDSDQDGFIEPSGWVSRDDGFLIRDLNGNGMVDGAAEMFGTPTQSGFAVLGSHDANSDGKIDGLDAIN